MKIYLALILVSAIPAWARLGETLDQCQMRYGTSKAEKGALVLYYKDKFDILVRFGDGQSVEETFTPNTGATLSDDMIAELLTANSAGAAWTIEANNSNFRYYKRSDGFARAIFKNNSKGQTLTISSIVPPPALSQPSVPPISVKEPSSGF